MSDNYDNNILDHYTSVAQEHGVSAQSTMMDNRTREIETAFIKEFVTRYTAEDAKICDVGCGNGYTLSEIRKFRPNATLFGVEYTPALFELAEKRFLKDDHVNIISGDIRNSLGYQEQFDAIICQRVIINLLALDHQVSALQNLIDAILPGGHCLFIEAVESGLRSLNDARSEFELEAIGPAHHNLYLPDNFFESNPRATIIEDPALKRHFLSSHYFVSRVLHPLCLGDRQFKRNSNFVRFFSEALAPAVGNYSPLQAFVLQKEA